MWRSLLIVLLVTGVAFGMSTADKMLLDTPSFGKVVKNPIPSLRDFTLVESQNFDDGNIPADWEILDANGDGCTWLVVSSPTDPYEPGCWDGSPFLQYSDDDCDTDSDDWIMTAVFSTAPNGQTYLFYDFDFEELGSGSPNEYGDVMIGESDDGTNWTWTVVSSYNFDTGEMCDITEGPVTVSSNFARWAFRYWEDTPSQWAWGWYIDNVEVYYEGPTGVSESNFVRVNNFEIVPNPATGSATVSFTLSKSAHISVSLLDVSGRVVKRVANGVFSGGEHTLRVSANPGVYFVKLETAGKTTLEKLVILK